MAKWFHTRLREARETEELSRAELAEKFGVSGQTIYNWENKISDPRDEARDRALAWLEKVERGGKRSRTARRSDTEARAKDSDSETVEPAGPSAVGAWLNRVRVTKGFSVPELSRRAGVSTATIYFIESGRIQTPRRETLDKLQRAVGESDPKMRQEAQEQATIEGIGVLTDFDPHDEDNLPNGPGVYVFYDVSERPIYVGQSGEVRKRILDYENMFWFRPPIVESGSYVEVTDRTLRKQVETLLIKFLKSNAVLNIQNVERD
jgi:transcriptional regulator with XRE-family HTH domain